MQQRQNSFAPRELDRDQSVRSAAAAEHGEDLADELPPVEPLDLPIPPDAGAARVVDSLVAAVSQSRSLEPEVRVNVSGLRNLSRCKHDEFAMLQSRLAELLTHAGDSRSVVFTTSSDGAGYELLGTAYLVTADGFDMWELFLSLGCAGKQWAMWEAPGPVRLLRQPRPGDQQVFPLW